MSSKRPPQDTKSSLPTLSQDIDPQFGIFSKSNILVIGASQSGKTTSVLTMMKLELVNTKAEKIFYLYGAHQPFMDSWNKDKSNPPIVFVKGLNIQVVDRCKGHKILIIDDLILELNRELANHFIAGSHHKNVTTFFISHSLYLNNELYRLISNNCQYIMLFKNKRNLSQVSRLGRQILGAESDRLTEAYKSLQPFQFVLLQFHPRVPEELLVVTNFFSKCPSVFI